jgi:2,3-bisphosphoglycerate-independent phosphoglycerate mutase
MVTGQAPGGKYVDALRGCGELQQRITDEFVEPFVCVDASGKPVGLIQDNDAVICFNYRADRVRQITRAGAAVGAERRRWAWICRRRRSWMRRFPDECRSDLHYVTMTQYDPKFALPMVIPPESMDNLLANVMGVA